MISIKRHELDKADMQRQIFGQRYKICKFMIVDTAHHYGIYFDMKTLLHQ